jgi:hypothetical protein
MGKFHDSIKPAHKEFIQKQHIFFVATAPLSADGRINLSPKGLDCFRILSDHHVAYMDLVSSGNETSAHTLENGRITFMFCSFEGAPNILRLYGKGFAVLRDSEEWNEYAKHFTIYPSTRQIIVGTIYLVKPPVDLVCLCTISGETGIYISNGQKKRAQMACMNSA